MTPEERQLKIAEAELGFYGEIISPEAKAAYDSRAAKRAVATASAPPGPAPTEATVPPRASATSCDGVSYFAVNAKNPQGAVTSRTTHIIKTGSGYNDLTLCGVWAGRLANVFHPSEVSCSECRRRWQLAMANAAHTAKGAATSPLALSESAPARAAIPPQAQTPACAPAYLRALDLSLSPRDRALAKEAAAADPEQWQKYVAARRAQRAEDDIAADEASKSGGSGLAARRETPPSPPAQALPAKSPSTHPATMLPVRSRSGQRPPASTQRHRSGQTGGGAADARRPGNAAAGSPSASPEGFGGDGLFIVGLDIRPGVYRTAGPASERGGSFALLKSTSMHDLVDYSTVEGPETITVGPGIKAVRVSGCQPWHRLGDTLDEVIAAATKPESNADPG
jgi:hypothetical protein